MSLPIRTERPTLVFAIFRNDPPGQMTGGTRSNLEIVSRLQQYRPVVITNMDDDFTRIARSVGATVYLTAIGDPGRGFKANSFARRLGSIWDVLRINLVVARIARRERAWAVQVDEVQAYLSFIGARLAGSRLLIYVRNGLPDRPLRARYRIPMLCAANIICLSREMASMLASRLPPRFQRRIRQHYNAVSLESDSSVPAGWCRDSFRRSVGWPSNSVVVLVVGFVDARKRQSEFLAALANVPNLQIHVAIVGPAKDEKEWAKCHDLVREHGLPVSFHGYQAEMSPWYRAAEIVALPSSAEGVPRAILEGAGAGLPTVAFDIPGCREAIIHGETGLLASSMPLLIEAISRLASSPDLRQKFGEAGRNHVLNSFEARRNVARLEDLYRELN